MTDFISLILPLLTSGGMIYLIIQAIIAKRQATREHHFSNETKMLEQLMTQNNDLVLFLEKNIKETSNEISKMSNDIMQMRDELTDHIIQDTAINKAIVKVMRGHELDGELKIAEYFIEIEEKQLGEKFKV